jgi:hypothetical protein
VPALPVLVLSVLVLSVPVPSVLVLSVPMLSVRVLSAMSLLVLVLSTVAVAACGAGEGLAESVESASLTLSALFTSHPNWLVDPGQGRGDRSM